MAGTAVFLRTNLFFCSPIVLSIALNPPRKRVCHLSNLHVAFDTRIFFRFCRSLAKHYDVTLIAVHPREEVVNGIRIVPIRRLKSRYFEMATASFRMFPKALRARAHIYHIHDPELIPCGLWLRLLGKKVIFDVHENFAADIADKPWIRHKKPLAALFAWWEKRAVRRFELLLAENSYAPHYDALGARYTVVLNYPDLPFFRPYRKLEPRQAEHLFYIGILLETRGLYEIAEALYLLKQQGRIFHFHCIGELYSRLEQGLQKLPFFEGIKDQLHFYGRMRLDEGYALSMDMGIGLCIIHPMKNSVESYPTKMFEYMSIGLPLIASDFPLYRNVVEQHACGLCVDPLKPSDLALAILRIAGDDALRLQMAKNGVNAAEAHYSWESQEKLVLEVYEKLSAG
jgi:glycosyltransferase involved in cell wall biosynthesis